MRLHAVMSKIAATDAANSILFANRIISPQPNDNMPAGLISGKWKSKQGLFQIGHAPISLVTSASLFGLADTAICR
jgi:hypothetical protein